MSLMRRTLFATRSLAHVCIKGQVANLPSGRALYGLRHLNASKREITTDTTTRKSVRRCLHQAAVTDEDRVVVSIESDHVALALSHDSPSHKFHHIWLRDHCHCASCYFKPSHQRLVDTHQIPTDIHPKEITEYDDRILVQWSDGHESEYTLEWLEHNSYSAPSKSRSIVTRTPTLRLWGQDIAQNPPTVHYDDVMRSDEAVADWLRNIQTYGFSFVDGVPATPQDTKKLAERIAFIRETHYGGFWDFTPNMEFSDTAYTNFALGAHTDNTYWSDAPGLQMLHCLHFNGKGGMSLLVDGFKVARELQAVNPGAYDFLAKTIIRGQCVDAEREFISEGPIIRENAEGGLEQIRFNNDDRSVLNHLPFSEVPKFYSALRAFNNILRSPQIEYKFQLLPGRAVIFDNWRVLHGRDSFTGMRRLCGAYHNRDDVLSRSRMLGVLPRHTM
eukprot:Colp12_sorted_trinity150504_noHs@12160